MLSFRDFEKKQIAIALVSRGEKISFKNDNIVIKDENGKIRHQSSCYRLFALFVIGHYTLTTGILLKAKRFGFGIFLLSHSLKPFGSWLSGAEGNTLLRQKQYFYDKNEIANYIVMLKISQQIEYLNIRRDKPERLISAIKKLKIYKNSLKELNLNTDTLLGIEGSASRIYFKSMFDNIDWQSRRPRVKNDIANLLLDIGYTQLFNFIDALLNLYGFDTYKGVYHREFYQRKSLVCDLVEPFRPIVDYEVRKLFTLNRVDTTDFTKIDGRYMLFNKNAQKYTSFLLKNLMEHKELMFKFIRKYYLAFIREYKIEQFPKIKKGEVI